MNKIYGNYWEVFDKITGEEALENALSDPDAQPLAAGPKVELRKEDDAVVLERFRKAILREEQQKMGEIGHK